MKKIDNAEQLRSEIVFLEQKKQEQRAAIKKQLVTVHGLFTIRNFVKDASKRLSLFLGDTLKKWKKNNMQP